MSHQITIQSLPNEMLMCIFRHLDWYDLQSAMLVCQRWASVRDSVAETVLKIYMSDSCYNERNYNYFEVIHTLCYSQRPYRNLCLIWDREDEVWGQDDEHCYDFECIRKNILERFRQSVKWLKIRTSMGDPCGKVFDRELAKVLRTFPNLKHLDMDDVFVVSHRADGAGSDEEWENPGKIKLKPMIELRTLHAGGDFEGHKGGSLLEVGQNLSDAFANLTTLHAVIHTDGNHLKHLYHRLSSQLIHLKLYQQEPQPKLFKVFPVDDFPLLETFAVVCKDEVGDISDDHLGQFVKRAPNLKVLKLDPIVGIHAIEHFDSLQGTLRCLAICPNTLNSKILQKIVKLSNLQHLELSFIEEVDFRRLKNCPSGSQSIVKLKLAFSENEIIFDKKNRWFYRNCFPNLTELELVDSYDLNQCLALANHLPLLRRLILNNAPKPKSFLEFCSKLKVPELEMKHGFQYGNWDTSACKALFLRKLIIHADEIHAHDYVPMMQSMPALRKLELYLTKPCENKIVRNLAARFPWCDVVRKFSDPE